MTYHVTQRDGLPDGLRAPRQLSRGGLARGVAALGDNELP